MNREQITQMAHEAGFDCAPDGRIYNAGTTDEISLDDSLEQFAALVAAAEREACATFVDHILKEGGGTYGDAIRARSNT
jgi:hypothetical protein